MMPGYYGFMVCVHDLCHSKYNNRHRWYKPLSALSWQYLSTLCLCHLLWRHSISARFVSTSSAQLVGRLSRMNKLCKKTETTQEGFQICNN